MYNAPILKKAVEIIKLIVKEHKPLGVTDIARSLSISKSTTFGILKSLEEEGFLVKDPSSKKYSTGSTLFELSKKILRTTDVAVTARPYLERLLEAVDETVFLGIREDEAVKLIDVLEPQKEFKISSSLGSHMSLVAGVVGKIFLSAMDNGEVAELLSPERPAQIHGEQHRRHRAVPAGGRADTGTGIRGRSRRVHEGREGRGRPRLFRPFPRRRHLGGGIDKFIER